jgi:hypothetical protein
MPFFSTKYDYGNILLQIFLPEFCSKFLYSGYKKIRTVNVLRQEGSFASYVFNREKDTQNRYGNLKSWADTIHFENGRNRTRSGFEKQGRGSLVEKSCQKMHFEEKAQKGISSRNACLNIYLRVWYANFSRWIFLLFWKFGFKLKCKLFFFLMRRIDRTGQVNT